MMLIFNQPALFRPANRAPPPIPLILAAQNERAVSNAEIIRLGDRFVD